MGNSEAKKERLRLDENDLSKINLLIKEIMDLILESFSTSSIQIDSWPKRYLLKRNLFQYEFIFSQMGSVTLRLAQSERYRRNPPPIFYISIGKYKVGEYVWEDINANQISTEKENLIHLIQQSIQNYESIILSEQ